MRTTTRGDSPAARRTTPNGRFSSGKSESAGIGAHSEVATALLVAFDRFEQGFEVPLAETGGTAPFDDLEEDRRPIRDRLGEDLQQMPLVVLVGEDVQPLQLRPGKVEAG